MAEDDLAPAIRAKARAEAFEEAAKMCLDDADLCDDVGIADWANALRSMALRFTSKARHA